MLDNKRVNCLYGVGRERELKQAVDIIYKMKEPSIDNHVILVKSLLKLNQISEAESEIARLNKLLDQNGQPDAAQLRAALCIAKGHSEEAIQIYKDILESDPNNADCHLELGCLLSGLNIYHQTSKDVKDGLIHLLKAVKLNPEVNSGFLRLGDYYKRENNYNMAKRCYERALNSANDEEAGPALSDLYRKMGLLDENFQLVQAACASSDGCKWAWLRLGLHYASQGDYERSVRPLQRAVQENPTDRLAFECLGDAYLKRGSYNAALKVFTKILQKSDPKDSINLYTTCRIAHINQLVGDYLSSIEGYELVLQLSDTSTITSASIRSVALTGLAQTLLTRCHKWLKECLISNLLSDIIYAVTSLTEAVSLEMTVRQSLTAWKLLGDGLTMLYQVPLSHFPIKLPRKLIKFDAMLGEIEEMNKDQALQLGASCYGVALNLDPLNAPVWHDLALNQFLGAIWDTPLAKWSKFEPGSIELASIWRETSKDQIWKKNLVEKATKAGQCLRKSLTLDSTNPNAWKSLGTVAYYMDDIALSQHSFLQSLNLGPSAQCWADIGALYLSRGSVGPAHQAFSQAQAMDPACVQAWIGQAMVATSVGHSEGFDLYRHASLLGFHPQGALGFANTLLAGMVNKEATREQADKMCVPKCLPSSAYLRQFVPNVVDALTFYARSHDDDPAALNLLGLSLECLSLGNSSLKAFQKGAKASTKDPFPSTLLDCLLSNCGRIFNFIREPANACVTYKQMKETDLYSQAGLGLAQLKGGDYEGSYSTYTEAFSWLASNPEAKGDILVALGALQFKFRNLEEVKTLLFKSSSPERLVALTSLGLLTADSTLSAAALAELASLAEAEDGSAMWLKAVADVAILKSVQASLQGNLREAQLILSKAIRQKPSDARIWRQFSRLLVSLAPNSENSAKMAEGAAKAAAAAAVLNQRLGGKHVVEDILLKTLSHLKSIPNCPTQNEGRRRKIEERRKKQEKTYQNTEISGSPPKISGFSQNTEISGSLRETQKAVLMAPSDPRTWLLMSCVMPDKDKAERLAHKLLPSVNLPLKNWIEASFTAICN